ncbi:four helix bundle protein [Fibrobacter sp. UWEL]|uniref:four helix bundle protein n=1 Tax=Fibrobacter sp. UWEL TaxID=1896209 RepID=UPI000920FBA2|nr:four helix bundle protein [Fibrobacter sp. UWEL]SHK64482.1 four helix bundle protein [Fibrobacter sp. UWEL]
MPVQNFRELIVWQKSIQLVVAVYELVKEFPKSELYALSDQMRRAAVSIPSNIAEGYERKSVNEYIHFLSIARGSKAELETQLFICEQLNFGNKEKLKEMEGLCLEIGKMLNRMISSLSPNP